MPHWYHARAGTDSLVRASRVRLAVHHDLPPPPAHRAALRRRRRGGRGGRGGRGVQRAPTRSRRTPRDRRAPRDTRRVATRSPRARPSGPGPSTPKPRGRRGGDARGIPGAGRDGEHRRGHVGRARPTWPRARPRRYGSASRCSSHGPGLADELDRLGARTVVRFSRGAAAAVTALAGDREVLDGAGELPSCPACPLQPPAAAVPRARARGREGPGQPHGDPGAVGPTGVTVDGHRPAHRGRRPRGPAPRRGDRGARPSGRVRAGGAVRPAGAHRAARRASCPAAGCCPSPARRMVALYGHPRRRRWACSASSRPQESVRAGQGAGRRSTSSPPETHGGAGLRADRHGGLGLAPRRTAPTRAGRRCGTLLPWVRGRRAGRRLRRARPAAGRDRLPHPGQGSTRSCCVGRGSGSALDPEWRLRPSEKPLAPDRARRHRRGQRVGAWLAGLVREHDLPPKVLTLHQFSRSMVRDRERLDTSLDEVQWLVHADGQGGAGRQAGHLGGAAARPAEGGVAGLEELRGRGHPDAHARSRPWRRCTRPRSSCPTSSR